MQIQKTIKFKIGDIGENKQNRLNNSIIESLEAIKKYMNLSIKYNTCSETKLHQLGYKEIRNEMNLASCILAQSRERASEIIKSWKSNKKRLKKSIDIPQPKSLRIRYNNVVFQIIETKNKKYPYFVSFLCEKGQKGKYENRIYLPIIVNSNYQKEYLLGLLSKQYKKGSADLTKDGEDYFVHIVIGKEVHIPQVNRDFTPIGVDLGINNLAVVNVSGKPKFFSGKRVLWKKQYINKLKADLQNRNNKKLLDKINGRENRFVNHFNHVISSYLIKEAKKFSNPVIVLEDLKYILETTKVRKNQRYIHQTWAFRQLQKNIEYKANWEGIPIIFIDSRYTSQICPKCFSTNKRVKHLYKCKYCNYEANADYVASLNITKRFFEAICFEKTASINNAVDKAFISQSMEKSRVQKNAMEVCNCLLT